MLDVVLYTIEYGCDLISNIQLVILLRAKNLCMVRFECIFVNDQAQSKVIE